MNDSEQELLKAWLEAAGADGPDSDYKSRERREFFRVLREVKASAWGEGYLDGILDAEDDTPFITANPYDEEEGGMNEYTPDVSTFRGVYGQMCAEWCRGDALAEFDRLIARIKAAALREALLSDETVERAARALNAAGWTCVDGAHEPGDYDECPYCRGTCATLARAALTAAIGGDDE